MSIVLLAITLGSGCDAFSPSRISWICSRQSGVLQFQPFPNHSHKRPLHELCATNGDKSTSNSSENADIERLVSNEMGLEIIRGTGLENSDELPNETWEDLEDGAPSKWMILKDLLGINIFTYILAGLIIVFLSMNAAFGPGWLGQSLGWENVGTFTKVSDSLPLDVDVSRPEYLL